MRRSADNVRPWRAFFVSTSTAVLLLLCISAAVSYAFERTRPPDCEACGLAAVGLVPLYLATAVGALILCGGFVVWLYRRTASPIGRLALAVLVLAALSALVVSIAMAF